MNREIIEIERIVRAMRGGSQGYLVEASDGHFYVSKFARNPQGTRTLINEWIAYGFLQQLGVLTPPLRILHLSEPVKRSTTNLCFSLGNRKVPITDILHLGSRCPVNPDKTAIYDLLPRKLLSNISNLPDFAKVFVADKLLGQRDSRQAIFVRTKGKFLFEARMIDHGLVFGGSQWELLDAPLSGMYFDRSVYGMLDMKTICEQATQVLDSLTEADLQAFAEYIPQSWFAEGDYALLEDLLIKVHKRIAALPDLIARHLEAIGSYTYKSSTVKESECERDGLGSLLDARILPEAC